MSAVPGMKERSGSSSTTVNSRAPWTGRRIRERFVGRAGRRCRPGLCARTASDPDANPVTGADLGAGPGAGTTTELVEDDVLD